MQQLIDIAAARGRGLIFTSDLTELGVTSGHLRSAVVSGELIRVIRGVYVRPPADRAFWPSEVHALRVRAAATMEPRDCLVSHLSAAALHGLPLIGAWPQTVHISMTGTTGGSSSTGITRHVQAVQSSEAVINGVRVTSLARTLIDVASATSILVGVTMMDAALRRGDTTKKSLRDELDRAGMRFGVRLARECIEFSDARSGSPGESLTRVRAWQLGFELPELQMPVRTRLGNFDVDFGWESCALFGEFDGKVKYTRDRYLKGRPIEEVVLAEKAREDSIRAETGRAFVRIVWREALSAPTLDGMLRRAGVPRARRPR